MRNEPHLRQQETLSDPAAFHAHEVGHYRLGHQFVEGEHVHVERGAFISQRRGRSSEAIDPKEIEALGSDGVNRNPISLEG